MKKSLFFAWGLCLAAGVLVASCSKEEGVAPATKEPVMPLTEHVLRIAPETMYLTADEAGQVLQLFMRCEGPGPATRAAFEHKTVAETFPICGAAGDVAAYAVNFAGGGFGIVSATKRFDPVLAFSDEGRLTPEVLRGNGIALWVEALTGEIAHAEATLEEDSPEYADVRAQWRAYERSEEEQPLPAAAEMKDGYYWYMQLRNEMMSSAIGFCYTDFRDYFYRASLYGVSLEQTRFTEEVNEQNRVLAIRYAGFSVPPAFVWGEGMTALPDTKIMPLIKQYWHQFYPYNNEMDPYPSNETGRQFPGCDAIAVAQILNYYRYPAQVDGHTIDWEGMNLLGASQNMDEVARFVRIVSEGVGTKYVNGKGLSTIDKSQTFLKRNGYAATIQASDIDVTVASEIKAGRPVYVRGQDPENGGHAWVCDGYYAYACRYEMESYTITDTSRQNFTTSPYFRTFSRSRTETFRTFYHMNWGIRELEWQDDRDPATLTGETNGWYRSVKQKYYPNGMKIMRIVKQ